MREQLFPAPEQQKPLKNAIGYIELLQHCNGRLLIDLNKPEVRVDEYVINAETSVKSLTGDCYDIVEQRDISQRIVIKRRQRPDDARGKFIPVKNYTRVIIPELVEGDVKVLYTVTFSYEVMRITTLEVSEHVNVFETLSFYD